MHVLVPCEEEGGNEVGGGNGGGDGVADLDKVGVQDVEKEFGVAHCDLDLLLRLVLHFSAVPIHVEPEVEVEVHVEEVVRDMAEEEDDTRSILVEVEDKVDTVHEAQVEGDRPSEDRDE